MSRRRNRTSRRPRFLPLQIGQFEIDQGVVEFRDESKPKPFSLDIVPIHIALKNFYTRPGGENTYAFTAELGKGETLAWEGTLSLEPIRSAGKLSLSGVKLRTLWQYLGDRFQFDLTDGVLAVNGSYNVDMQTSPPTLQISQAQMQVANLAVAEAGGLDPVIVVPVLKIDDVAVDVSKHDLTIGSIVVGDARWKAWRNPDGTVNYQTMFAPAEKTKPVRASRGQAIIGTRRETMVHPAYAGCDGESCDRFRRSDAADARTCRDRGALGAYARCSFPSQRASSSECGHVRKRGRTNSDRRHGGGEPVSGRCETWTEGHRNQTVPTLFPESRTTRCFNPAR